MPVHYVGIHQVRTLVFDNYQTCPVPLNKILRFRQPSGTHHSPLSAKNAKTQTLQKEVGSLALVNSVSFLCLLIKQCSSRLLGYWFIFISSWGLFSNPLFSHVSTTLGAITLKTLDTIGNCQRPVFSLCVSQHMHKIINLWKFELNWSWKLPDNNERKTPLSHEVVCIEMVDFETSNSKSEVSKSNSWKITSISKTMALQRETFLTMFYTINLSPLLVTN